MTAIIVIVFARRCRRRHRRRGRQQQRMVTEKFLLSDRKSHFERHPVRRLALLSLDIIGATARARLPHHNHDVCVDVVSVLPCVMGLYVD